MDQSNIKKNKYERRYVLCENCKKEFSFLPSKYHPIIRFCSLSCSTSYRNRTTKIIYSKERNAKISLFQKNRVYNYKRKIIRDLERQNLIEQYLKCNFIILEDF
jgi:hypothetical protein